MKLTSALFEGFLKCPTKCYLRSKGQTGTANPYTEWLVEKERGFRGEAAKRLMTKLSEAEVMVAPPAAEHLNDATWKLALDLPVQAKHTNQPKMTVHVSKPR